MQQLDRENFAVRQHLRYVEKFADPASYQALSYEDTLHLKEEVAPLLQPDMDEASAVRFDALMYGIELAYLVGKTYKKARKDLVKKVSGVASVANIPRSGPNRNSSRRSCIPTTWTTPGSTSLSTSGSACGI